MGTVSATPDAGAAPAARPAPSAGFRRRYPARWRCHLRCDAAAQAAPAGRAPLGQRSAAVVARVAVRTPAELHFNRLSAQRLACAAVLQGEQDHQPASVHAAHARAHAREAVLYAVILRVQRRTLEWHLDAPTLVGAAAPVF